MADASGYAQGVNDAHIASIVVTRQADGHQPGELAHAASSNADVKKYAQLMITDHTSVL